MAKQKVLGGASDVINDSRSGRALNRNPSLLRAAIYEPTLRTLLLVALAIFVVSMIPGVIGTAREENNPGPLSTVLIAVGGFLMLLSLGVALLAFIVWKAIKRNYANGLLSAGLVLEQKPLTLIVLANIGNGMKDTPTWGVVRHSPGTLPGHPSTPGEKIPCVCTFQEGDDADRWGDMRPMPVCHGRGGRNILQQANQAIGEDEYSILRRIIQEGTLPADDDHMVIVEEGVAPRTVRRGAAAQQNAGEAAAEKGA